MDVEKLIQAAKHCKLTGCKCETCVSGNDEECLIDSWTINNIRDHYEALLKAERSKVVQEVREWIDHNNFVDSYSRRVLRVSEIREKLDSMESDKKTENET